MVVTEIVLVQLIDRRLDRPAQCSQRERDGGHAGNRGEERGIRIPLSSAPAIANHTIEARGIQRVDKSKSTGMISANLSSNSLAQNHTWESVSTAEIAHVAPTVRFSTVCARDRGRCES
jgi:hypothetical protein